MEKLYNYKMDKVKFKPSGARVLVDVIFETEKKETVANILGGGAIDLESPEIREEIVEIPTDRCYLLRKSNTSQLTIKEGAKCIFNQHTGTPLKIGDKIYLLLNDNDIYGEEED